MPAGMTYDSIATTTVSSAVSDVTFSSISGSYTDLVLIISPISTSSSGVDIAFQFNSDTGSNYSLTGMYGNGTSAVSYRKLTRTRIEGAYSANTNPMLRYNIMNYSSTTMNKAVIGRDDTASNVAEALVGLWQSNSAITSIKIFATSGNITAGTFSLYGITAA